MTYKLPMYKLSQYNITIDNKDTDELIIFNTLRRSIFKSRNRVINRFIRAYDDVIDTEDMNDTIDEAIQLLINKEILVPNEYNERKVADMIFHEMVYSNSLMTATIIPTEKCNFQCIYCYENGAQKSMTQETAQNLIRYFSETLPKFQRVFINWYGGEPLMEMNMIRFIMSELQQICRSSKTVLLSSVTTNGSLLTPDNMNCLLDVGVNMFQLSLDGNEATHNRQRPLKLGGNSYRTIMNNLQGIRDLIKKRRFEIVIRVNITDEVNFLMPEILDEYEQNFANNPRFSMSFQWIRDWGGDINKNLPTAAHITKKWINEATKRGIHCNDILTNNCGLEYCDTCRKHGYFFDIDGSMKKCSIAIYDENYQDVNTVGYVNKMGKAILDKRKEAEWISREEPEKKCNSCPVYPMCMSVNCSLSTQIKKTRNCMPIKGIISDLLENRASFAKYDFI